MHRRQRPEAGNGTPVQLTQVGSISRSTRRHTPCRALVGKSPDQELPSSGSLRRSARSSLSGRGLLETRRPSSQFRGVPPRSYSQSHVRFFLSHFFLSLQPCHAPFFCFDSPTGGAIGLTNACCDCFVFCNQYLRLSLRMQGQRLRSKYL